MTRLLTTAHVVLLLLLLSSHVPECISGPTKYLCGPHLVEALYLVCGDRGFYYSTGKRSKRDLQALLVLLSKSPVPWRPGKHPAETERMHMEVRKRRGIVEQCCFKPCGIHHLQNYCE
ncbi:preproinsulin b [Engraulis encrasicolus]|uniref:preproinsulin b n=1 Tax=Engraulis encrasicolus TaxID=184585 RepID=UPI002FD06ADD